MTVSPAAARLRRELMDRKRAGTLNDDVEAQGGAEGRQVANPMNEG